MSLIKRITTIGQVKELIRYCKQTKTASVDWETTGLKYYEPYEKPLCLSVSFQPGSSWVIPLAHKESCFRKNNQWKKAIRLFGKQVMEDWDIVKIAWNLKFEYKWFMKYGITMKGRLFDAQLAKYCLDEERPNDLKSWVEKLYPAYAGYAKEIKNNDDGEERKWENIPYDKLSEYCGIDSDLTGRLMVYFEKQLIKNNFYNLFRNLLMMSTRVLAESEYMGMLVDRAYLKNLVEEYKVKIADCSKRLNEQPALLKYNKIRRKQYIKTLIKETQLEVQDLRENNAPNSATLIRNRENKIKGFMEGKFNNKELKKLEPLNWGSPQQVGDFFYKSDYGLGLPILKYTQNKKTKQDSDNPSTDEETLLLLEKKDKTGTIKALLEYRGLTKLNSTYVEGMYNVLSSSDRIHTSYRVAGTVTGRISSAQPNLQNIPRGTGKDADGPASDIKKMFIPPKGMLMVEIDYGQAELRVVAELAKDKAMIDIFKRGYNIHAATACKINGGIQLYDECKVAEKDESHPKHVFWVREKKRAKTLNFQILYQGGSKKLATELDCTVDEAKVFTKAWFKEYPEASKWIDNQKKLARKQGYVRSPFGRKRRLWGIYSDAFGVVSEAERQAVNAPIQGTASDFGLLTGIAIREKVMKGELPAYLKQCCTVHDSIEFYVWPCDIHKILKIVLPIFENPDTLGYFGFQLEHVKMKASVEVTHSNWYDKHEYDPWCNYQKKVDEYLAHAA